MKNHEITVPEVPRGIQRLKWIGPAIIWLVSAIATGELLFTPRVASLYGYSVLWAMLLAIFFKAFLAREIGRYAVVTGGSLLRGITLFPGPKNWGVWLIIVPQLFVAVTTITGMAGAAGSALILALPGSLVTWGIVLLVISLLLVYLGKYKFVEKISLIMSLTITAALIVAASAVFPGIGALAQGLAPGFPEEVDFTELLPWIGFMMSGAAGLVWYSYWIVARGYGSAHGREAEDAEPGDLETISESEKQRLKQWIKVMTLATGVAGILIFILLSSLLILGTELLRPRGLIPEGPQVTRVLSQLLGGVWGPVGAWALIGAAFFAFWSTIIADADGWTRMLGQGSLFITRQWRGTGKTVSLRLFRYMYLFGLMGVLPVILILLRPEPFFFLQMGGIVEAIHIPVVAFSALYLNLKKLPDGLKPSVVSIILTVFVGLFFTVFSGYYLYTKLIAG